MTEFEKELLSGDEELLKAYREMLKAQYELQTLEIKSRNDELRRAMNTPKKEQKKKIDIQPF